jgi:hypothetical protein
VTGDADFANDERVELGTDLLGRNSRYGDTPSRQSQHNDAGSTGIVLEIRPEFDASFKSVGER